MDADLQALRRRAAATGSPEDRAAVLRARVRSGELAQELLELAAYSGDVPARLVVGVGVVPVPAGVHEPQDTAGDWESVDGAPVGAWLGTLARWWQAPARAPVRAILAIQKIAVWRWRPSIGPGGQGLEVQRSAERAARRPALEALGAIEEWLADPTPSRFDRVCAIHDGPRPWSELPAWLRHLLSLVIKAHGRVVPGAHCWDSLAGALRIHRSLLDGAERDHARAALVSWALREAR